VTFYLRDLAATYHSYYDAERILVDDEAIKRARLALIAATAQVHGLTLVTRNVADFEATGVALLNPWQFQAGENFTELDVQAARKVCLIGKTTSATLFGDGVNPVGQVVRIKNNVPFTVVGWLAAKGANAFGQDQDDVILLPYTSAMKRLSGDTKFRSMNVQAESAAAIVDVQNQITELLRQRHRIGPGKEDDFSLRNQQEMSDFVNANNRIMTVLIGAFAGISLVVGGIGIMNIMLVSVTERTREIGIRLAVGARGRDVLRQFLTEAVLLSMVGGAFGIAAGHWLARLLTAFAGFPTLISHSSVILAFSVSALIGIIFGFFPALKAANLDPIDALRYE